MAAAHHVLLVPGFFGFARLGEFAYFAHVRDFLAEALPAAGVKGEVEVVHTIPTASLARRAALLAESAAKLAEKNGAVSIVGHSSGGLDARLLVAPDARLPTEVDVERCARRVRAVVTVATPHFGTPLAHTFDTLLGQQLLKLLSVSTMYGLRAGRLPMGVVLRLARVFRRRAAPAGVVDQIWRQLLQDFSADRRREIEDFFAHVGADRDLVTQLTPAGTEVFNATTRDRPGVRYGCVVTRARKPGLRSFVGAGIDPYAHATHALFVALYRLASRTRPERVKVPREVITALSRAFRKKVDARTNDGLVPTLSQVWGEVVRTVWADHHDVIGHFHHPTHVPPHFDWVASGTGFTRAQFEAVWRDVAVFVAGAARG